MDRISSEYRALRDKIDGMASASRVAKEKLNLIEGRLDEIEPSVMDVESKIKKGQDKGKMDFKDLQARLELVEGSLEQWRQKCDGRNIKIQGLLSQNEELKSDQMQTNA